jgi:hypothetical protein
MVQRMLELLAKANQVILEARFLRREQQSLRFEANILASRLGEIITEGYTVDKGFGKPASASERTPMPI